MNAITLWKPQLNTVYEMDANLFLRSLPDESVHLQIFDPLYGIGYKSNWKTTNGRKPRTEMVEFAMPDVFDASFLSDAYRVLKTGGACYLFTQWTVLHLWRFALEESGYKVHQLIIWDKLHWGAGNLASYGNQTEMVLFATKGKHELRWDKRQGNLWKLTKLDTINYEGNLKNPTQKPQRLIQRAILNSSDKGDIVLDCHCGTGTTPAAANETGRLWYACDIDSKQVKIAQTRLSKPHNVRLFA